MATASRSRHESTCARGPGAGLASARLPSAAELAGGPTIWELGLAAERLLLAVSVARSSQGGAQSNEEPPLVLLIDGLDEADADPSRQRDNPVERMLPYRLPPGVVMVVASRPRYPHLGWQAGSAGQQLLEPAREALLEEPGEWHGEPQPRYRLFHDAMRDMLCQKLRGALQEHHEHLARRIATWPALESEGFGFDYALRFAISHRVEAARLQGATARESREAATQGKAWQRVVEPCSCVPFLVAKVEHLGGTSLERDLESAARACPADQGAEALRGLERAIRQESHWLRASAEGLPGLLYNQLLTRGWSAERLRQGLEWGDGFPVARLRLPLQRADQCLRVRWRRPGLAREAAGQSPALPSSALMARKGSRAPALAERDRASRALRRAPARPSPRTWRRRGERRR